MLLWRSEENDSQPSYELYDNVPWSIDQPIEPELYKPHLIEPPEHALCRLTQTCKSPDLLVPYT